MSVSAQPRTSRRAPPIGTPRGWKPCATSYRWRPHGCPPAARSLPTYFARYRAARRASPSVPEPIGRSPSSLMWTWPRPQARLMSLGDPAADREVSVQAVPARMPLGHPEVRERLAEPSRGAVGRSPPGRPEARPDCGCPTLRTSASRAGSVGSPRSTGGPSPWHDGRRPRRSVPGPPRGSRRPRFRGRLTGTIRRPRRRRGRGRSSSWPRLGLRVSSHIQVKDGELEGRAGGLGGLPRPHDPGWRFARRLGGRERSNPRSVEKVYIDKESRRFNPRGRAQDQRPNVRLSRSTGRDHRFPR